MGKTYVPIYFHKVGSKAYNDNYDSIFKKPKKKKNTMGAEQPETQPEKTKIATPTPPPATTPETKTGEWDKMDMTKFTETEQAERLLFSFPEDEQGSIPNANRDPRADTDLPKFQS